jgi:ketosteroid isomerase-like protein
MQKTSIFVAILLVLAVAGCAQRVDIEAEQATIQNMANQWSSAANAQDVEGVLALYSKNASVFPPNAAIVTGSGAIRELWSSVIGSPGYFVSVETDSVEVSSVGDLACSQGTYSSTANDSEGNPVTETGKWVVVSKKQADGDWRIVTHIWNLNEATAPAATEQ